MKKIIVGIMFAAILTGCSSLTSRGYNELERDYERLLSSNITDEKVLVLEKKYLELKNNPEQPLSEEELRKINLRLQVLEDLKN